MESIARCPCPVPLSVKQPSIQDLGQKNMVRSDLQKKLQKKAGALLARRAYSRGEIRKKLLRMADKPDVDIILDHLEELKLLNDLDYAYNFALYRVGREGWGPEKIRSALYRRHISTSDVSSALERIRSLVGDDFALAEYLKRVFAKRGAPDKRNDVRNLVTHLLRRGYNRKSIVEVLKKSLPADIVRDLETGD
jgi:SOS response regulatory protein OraA/RecX